MLSTSVISKIRRFSILSEPLLVVLLLCTHVYLALSASYQKSTTADEIAHLTAGQSYWVHNDYRLQPENGNLPQRWVALPSWIQATPLPASSAPAWKKSDVWSLGRSYFYELGNSADQILLFGRAMNLAWSIATALLIFFWSRRLFGPLGAFISLFFYCLDPNFLVHGALATSDLCMCFFFLASVTAFWLLLEEASPSRLLLSGIVFGLSCVAKFSAVLLPFMFLLLLATHALFRSPFIWRKQSLGKFQRAGAYFGILLFHAAAAWVIIWCFFGLRWAPGGATLPELVNYYRPWEIVRAGLGTQGEFLWWLSQLQLLPDAYVFGFGFVLDMSQQRGSFLNGEYSLTGWLSFFPYAFIAKSPLALLGAGLSTLLLWGGQLWDQRDFSSRRSLLITNLRLTAPLWILFVVYAASSLLSHLNIGHRHILPLYPALFVCLGFLGSLVLMDDRYPFFAYTLNPQRSSRFSLRAALLLGALLGLLLFESFSVRPHYLAFFNSALGGPQNGYKHLVDSSLDWGQDLPALATWLKTNHSGKEADAPTYLAYFGTGDPHYYGIQARSLPCIPRQPGLHSWGPLNPGIYCISATMLQHVYSPLRGPWSSKLEEEYQSLRHLESAFYDYARSPEQRLLLEKEAPASHWEQGWERFSQLRFARLCHYLRIRKPDAMPGYSILVYRLTQSELHAACNSSLTEWKLLMKSGSAPN